MKRIYTGLFLLTFILISNITFSQSSVIDDTSKNIILLKERSYGIILHNQGWGIKYSTGYNTTDFRRRMFQFELVEMTSLRQIRSINPYYPSAKSYIYGKLNSVFLIMASYGMHKRINRKPYWGGVELRFLYMGGASLGFAKPVYLYIVDDLSSTISEERYDPESHYPDNIFGRAPFTKGFNNIGVYPGLHGRIGLDFDYASYRTKIKSLEVGAILDVFPRPIPIMAFNDPNYYFLTLYLSFNFGKRFN